MVTSYGLDRLFVDLNSDLVAREYAEYLMREEHNMEYFKSLYPLAIGQYLTL